MKGTKMKNKIEIEILAKEIAKLYSSTENIMEREIALPRMLRQLYKALGKPDPKEYEGVGNHIRSVDRISGYTKYPIVKTKDQLEYINGDVDYCINRPSETKLAIVESYRKDGWSCRVQAYNVLCDKYVPHKDYENIWIRFYSSRDCSKYEYVIVKEEK